MIKKTRLPSGVLRKMSLAVLVDQDVNWEKDKNAYKRVLVPPSPEKLKVIRDLALNEQAACGDFFRVWLWADDGEDRIKGTSLVMPLPQDLRFNLQFGRRVLAKLLGLEARFTWQDCAQTEEEETRDVEAFRSAFKDWDFTLQEDGA